MGSIKSRFKGILGLLVLTVVLVTAGCNGGGNKEPQKIDPAFSQYVTGFTSGVVSRKSELKIRLAEASKMYTEGGTVEGFKWSPSVEGIALWENDRTIVFRPTEPLSPGTLYDVSFNLGGVLDVEEKFQEFKFSVQTVEQSYDVKVLGMSPYKEDELGWNRLDGIVRTADYVASEDVEGFLAVSQLAEKMQVTWAHDASGRVHNFTVDSVVRAEEVGSVLVEWSGGDIEAENDGRLEFEVPSLNDFRFMSVDVVQQPEQYIHIKFSDPLNKNQDLKGMIHLEGFDNFRYVISGNEVKAYTKKRQTGVHQLLLEKGILNSLDYKFKETEKIEIAFQEVSPAVQLVRTGTILPSTDGLVFPFKAVNLRAVDVKVIRIFENNVPQFLQVNRMSGSYQMNRVGRVVVKKKINLSSTKPIDFGVWNNFSLDLKDLINEEPGAIYRIELDFKRSYSMYTCDPDDPNTDQEDPDERGDSWAANEYEDGAGSWGYYEQDSHNYYSYDWQQRNNPCNKAYYARSHRVTQNVFASNIGMIAKAGKDKKLLIACSDLRTTEPLKGVKVEVFNFQLQKVADLKTDKDGMIRTSLKMKPFLLVAHQGKERGYLELDDGAALSTSTFDVSGVKVQKGVKGFIYGERGVWRPGDTLFLTFLLEDKMQALPKGHPVKFELQNPLGQITHRMVKNEGVNGFYDFAVVTDSEAPTGAWTCRVKVGGAIFTKFLRVETVKPNRLKIKLDWGVDHLSASMPDVRGDMEVKWLHGSPAKNLRTNIEVTLTQMTTKFEGYEDYHFTDPANRYRADAQTLYDGKLDATGHAKINPKLKVSDRAPGMLRANFVTRVFEEAGDFSIDRFTIPYSPYERYVGIKLPEGNRRGTLMTDTAQVVEVVTINGEGEPVDVANLDVRVYKVHWRWWWDSYSDNLAQYVGSSYNKWVQDFSVSTKNGKGKFEFSIDYPDWGRYMVRVTDRAGNHSTGKVFYVDWPGWHSRGNRANPGGATMLSFATDKDKYEVGDKAIVTIPASGKGRALVTVETGSKVLDAEWIEVVGDEIKHAIDITPEMAPNAYVNVTMLQPHKHENDLPIRMYGVMPLLVRDPGTILAPKIDMPDELAPEKAFTLKVSEDKGRKMTYTVAIVDEGLLDLTSFKTPNPHPVFYAREALGVKTWDLYNQVVGAYGAKLESLLAIGGDGGKNGKDKNKVNRFKPMVKFLGPFELKRGETASHKIMMPNYIGSVRTMVIAGQDAAYGRTDKATPVKKPLMVLATLPRVLGPGEHVKLPVTVFAMDKKIKSVKVKITANKKFDQDYQRDTVITFKEIGDHVVNFELDVADAIGKGEVHVEVSSGNEKSTYDIELLVRNPNPMVHDFVDTVVDAGNDWTSSYDLIGVQGTNSAVLELSNMMPLDFDRRMRYLIEYPHGCVEQTTSRAFPQLYMSTVMELDEKVEARTKDNVNSALRKLRSFQHGDGGFSYWPSGHRSSDWGTSYAGHFMLEAEAMGYVLPVGMKSRWIGYQASIASNYSSIVTNDRRGSHRNHYYDMSQAYRLFTLAMAGKPEIGAMNKLKSNHKLGPTGILRLAAAYHLAGQPEVAKSLAATVGTYVPMNGNRTYSYGSVTRDRAMMLEALIIMGQRDRGISIMKELSNQLVSKHWMSTQTTSYSLLAMAKFAGKSGTSKSMKFQVIDNGKKQDIHTTLPLRRVELSVDQDPSEVILKNVGDGLMYARLIKAGQPAVGNEQAKESNLKMSVRYGKLNGGALDISKIEQGTDFYVEVTVTNPNNNSWLENMALSQIFPSGWEIRNTRMDGTSNVHQASVPEYQDIRDDRVYTYFDLAPYSNYRNGHTKTFRLLLNASYVGKYYLPAVLSENMYDNNINARTAGQWVEVVKPGQ